MDPVHGLGVDTSRPDGLARAYRERMPSAATAVQPYGQGDSGEEMRLELLTRPEPATSSGQSLRLSGINAPDLAVITRPAWSG
jgi:hypothetical protein